MGHVAPAACPACGVECPKIFSVPHVQEDRTRFWRDGKGGRYSSALGQELPDSRAGIEAVCKARGIELTSPSELPHVRRAVEVGRAMKQGVSLTSKETFAHIAEPKEPAPSLAETLRRSGKMRAVMERIEVGYDNWRDRGAQSAAQMAALGVQALGEGAAILNPKKPVDVT